MATGSGIDQEKTHRTRMALGALIAVVSIMGIASQGDKEGTPTPSAISSMTTTAQGQVTGVSGDVGHHIYEVAFTDAKGDRHTAMSVANGSDEYSMGDFVKVSYDPANPDGGCRIERATIRVDGLIEQAERGSSSGTDGDRQSGKPSSGTTLAQRFLEREVDDDGDGDILSELSHLGRE